MKIYVFASVIASALAVPSLVAAEDKSHSVLYKFDPSKAGGVDGSIRTTWDDGDKSKKVKIEADLDFKKVHLKKLSSEFPNDCKNSPSEYMWSIHTKWNQQSRTSDYGSYAECTDTTVGSQYNTTKEDSLKPDKDGMVKLTYEDSDFALWEEEKPEWNVVVRAVCGNARLPLACVRSTMKYKSKRLRSSTKGDHHTRAINVPTPAPAEPNHLPDIPDVPGSEDVLDEVLEWLEGDVPVKDEDTNDSEDNHRVHHPSKKSMDERHGPGEHGNGPVVSSDPTDHSNHEDNGPTAGDHRWERTPIVIIPATRSEEKDGRHGPGEHGDGPVVPSEPAPTDHSSHEGDGQDIHDHRGERTPIPQIRLKEKNDDINEDYEHHHHDKPTRIKITIYGDDN